MKRNVSLRSIQVLVCVLLLFQFLSAFGAEDQPFEKGAQLPAFTLPAPDSPQAQSYLGLKSSQPCSISQFGAKMVLIEILSAMCPHCHKNAPIINRLYNIIQQDPSLARDVKIIGVCIGNNKTEVDAFKKTFKVPFPIFPDEKMDVANELEVMATPTMIVVSKDGKVLTSHSGVIEDFDGFLKELRTIHKKL